jgi:hypothetical protein
LRRLVVTHRKKVPAKVALVVELVYDRWTPAEVDARSRGSLQRYGDERCDAPPTSTSSIDALLADNPRALNNAELKAQLIEFKRARARLDAAEAATIAEFTLRGCCLSDGMVTAKAWLAHHTGIARAVAGSRVRLAKRLHRMPVTAAALAAGDVTETHARSMARCLTPRTAMAFARDETLLVAKAIGLEADDFDNLITRWLFLNDPNGPDPGDERLSEFRASPLLAGRTRLDGELELEDSAELLAELDTVYDELWRQDQASDDTDPLKSRTHAQRLAAALVEMARRSGAAGDRDNDDPSDEASSHRRPRIPQLVTIVDIDALAGNPAGLAELEDGTALPQSILQRWRCDSTIGRVVMTGRSIPIDLGRITYTASAGQRRALIARDRGCIVPGCKRKARWCEAHHVEPFPMGPTNLRNLVLLCKRHHKHVHARIVELVYDEPEQRWIATRHDGTPLLQRPPPLLVA